MCVLQFCSALGVSGKLIPVECISSHRTNIVAILVIRLARVRHVGFKHHSLPATPPMADLLSHIADVEVRLIW